jgi:hypothetical protein
MFKVTKRFNGIKINFERKKINPHWSLAREMKAKVVTGDEDFRNPKDEVIVLE